MFDGEHIRGCYLPTRFLLDDARVFTPTGEKETAVGALQVVILPHEACIGFCISRDTSV